MRTSRLYVGRGRIASIRVTSAWSTSASRSAPPAGCRSLEPRLVRRRHQPHLARLQARVRAERDEPVALQHDRAPSPRAHSRQAGNRRSCRCSASDLLRPRKFGRHRRRHLRQRDELAVNVRERRTRRRAEILEHQTVLEIADIAASARVAAVRIEHVRKLATVSSDIRSTCRADSMTTSCAPVAVASSTATAGNLFGTTRTCHRPAASSCVNTAAGVDASCPGQKGQGPLAAAALVVPAAANSFGRSARCSASSTVRPVSQSLRSSVTLVPVMNYRTEWLAIVPDSRSPNQGERALEFGELSRVARGSSPAKNRRPRYP